MAEEKLLTIKIITDVESKEIGSLQQNLIKLTKRRNELNKKVRDGNRLTNSETRELGKLQSELVGTRNKLRDMERSVVKNNNALKKNSGFVAGIKKGMTSAITSIGLMAGGFFALTRVVGDIAGRIREFDKTMTNLSGVLGVSREDMRDLESVIISVAGSSTSTSSEVASLAASLAALGKGKDDIKTLLKPVNDLSIALQSTADETGEFLVQTLNAFGQGTGSADEFANVIAKMRTSTALDFERMKDAFGFLAPTANALNLTVQETGAILGVLNDNGIKAARAGRLMSSSFLRLAKNGITLEQALEKINTAQSSGATELEVLSVAGKTFGTEAAALGIILANNTEKTKEYTDQFNNAGGSLDELTNVQLQSLDSRLKILDSSWEKFILSLAKGDGAIGKTFKILVDSLSTTLDMLSELGKTDTQKLIEAAEAFDALDKADFLKNINIRLANLIKNSDDAGVALTKEIERLTALNSADERVIQTIELYTNKLAELTKGKDKDSDSTGDLVVESISLIEVQEQLLKQAKLLPESTVKEIAAKNEKIKVIQDEIKFLNQLNELSIQRGTIEKLQAQEATVINQTKEQQLAGLELAKSTSEENDIARSERLANTSAVDQQIRDETFNKRITAINQIGEITNTIENALNAKAQSDTKAKLRLVSDSAKEEIEVLQNKLDQGILSEEEFADQKLAIDNKRAADELAIQKDAFNKKKKLDAAFATLEFARELASIASASAANPTNVVTFGGAGAAQYAVQAAIAAARYGINLATISSQQFAEGGAVLSGQRINSNQNIPTQSNGDNVLATVRTGEVVLNKRQQSLLGGNETFRNIGVPGFAGGGRIGGTVTGQPQLPNIAETNRSAIQEGQMDLINAIDARFDRMKVVNVATETTQTARKVSNIESEASF